MNQEKILTLIDSPYITEKASKLASEKNQVVFKVNINANKLEIKKAYKIIHYKLNKGTICRH